MSEAACAECGADPLVHVRMRRHIAATRTKIINKLVELNSFDPKVAKILTEVRDLLDDLDQVKNWDYSLQLKESK